MNMFVENIISRAGRLWCKWSATVWHIFHFILLLGFGYCTVLIIVGLIVQPVKYSVVWWDESVFLMWCQQQIFSQTVGSDKCDYIFYFQGVSLLSVWFVISERSHRSLSWCDRLLLCSSGLKDTSTWGAVYWRPALPSDPPPPPHTQSSLLLSFVQRCEGLGLSPILDQCFWRWPSLSSGLISHFCFTTASLFFPSG